MIMMATEFIFALKFEQFPKLEHLEAWLTAHSPICINSENSHNFWAIYQ